METLCALPNLYELADMEQDAIDAKQAEIDALLKLYRDQITLDYDAFKLQKERVILLLHLAQRQAAEIQLNDEIQLNEKIDNKIIRKSADLENSIRKTLKDHRALMRPSLK